MAKIKTTETERSVTEFINEWVTDEAKRNDSFRIIDIYKKLTGFEPKMWGPSIVGFGSYHYKYQSGHEGDMPLAAFSPRKDAIVFYMAVEFEKKEELLKKFGKHKTGKCCIYVKKLSDIDVDVLKEMTTNSMDQVR